VLSAPEAAAWNFLTAPSASCVQHPAKAFQEAPLSFAPLESKGAHGGHNLHPWRFTMQVSSRIIARTLRSLAAGSSNSSTSLPSWWVDLAAGLGTDISSSISPWARECLLVHTDTAFSEKREERRAYWGQFIVKIRIVCEERGEQGGSCEHKRPRRALVWVPSWRLTHFLYTSLHII